MTRTLLPRTDFDAYIAVDFSANATPKRGRDSIWWSRTAWSNGRLVVREARNPRTRDLAITEIREELLGAVARRESVLVGFDFPYGYPAGFAASLGLPAPAWRTTWELLREQIEDRSASLVWPFETGPRLPPRPRGEGRIVHAEIYPSLVPIQAAPGRVKDALQVEAQTLRLAELDRRRELQALLEVPARLSPAVLADVLSEEGWILGVTGDGRRRPPR